MDGRKDVLHVLHTIPVVGICAKHAVSCWAPNERFRHDLLESSEILSEEKKVAVNDAF